MKDKPCVYCFKCPDTNKVMYVGMTKYPYNRYFRHSRYSKTPLCLWIKELKRNNKEVVFEQIKIFNYKKNELGMRDHQEIKKRLRDFEKKQIKKFKIKREAIFNINY